MSATGAGLVAYRIKLVRGLMGLPESKRRVVHAIGLRWREHTITRTATPSLAGMLLKVKEVLEVSVVPHENPEGYAEYRKIKAQMRTEAAAARAEANARPIPPHLLSSE